MSLSKQLAAEDLANRLETKAHMIIMGERITLHSEAEMMEEAAEMLRKLAKPVVCDNCGEVAT